ncbi:C2 domain-containing protein 5 [Microtus ochrogaster]|uniref:C2 domain-containing protein 5 n=1 Tax=Microtus ochrogaster TaxID=79684 RepID=A0A8J6L1C6_MICOH|nr:C2 domain-containing protein 5 [Microtus ochrogaster]
MPGKLKVKIVAGRHLPVMDRASDLTDAFVEVGAWSCPPRARGAEPCPASHPRLRGGMPTRPQPVGCGLGHDSGVRAPPGHLPVRGVAAETLARSLARSLARTTSFMSRRLRAMAAACPRSQPSGHSRSPTARRHPALSPTLSESAVRVTRQWHFYLLLCRLVDDEDLQDEPLQITVLDHDTYSANDAIGKVYIDIDPLLYSEAATVISGWFPIYDTIHGIRGEINVVVKVDLFNDLNRFRQSSCGVKFFCTTSIPKCYRAVVIHGFVEELVVNEDPEYQWIDRIRTPRASNEARQRLISLMSGELQRKIGLKVLEMRGNAVVGYLQCFDLEGESGLVVRAIGTACTLDKLSSPAAFLPACNSPSKEMKESPLVHPPSHGCRSTHNSPIHTATGSRLTQNFSVSVPTLIYTGTRLLRLQSWGETGHGQSGCRGRQAGSIGRIPFNEDPNPNPHSSGPSTPLKNQTYSFSPSKSYSRQSSSSDTDMSLTPKTAPYPQGPGIYLCPSSTPIPCGSLHLKSRLLSESSLTPHHSSLVSPVLRKSVSFSEELFLAASGMGSGSAGKEGGPFKALLRQQTQAALEQREFPFLTLTAFPPGLLVHVGGVVSARSVKLLDRIHNPDEPETRDAWWAEIRQEIKSHAKALGCHAVVGYSESTSICEEVCILSASGTAAVLNPRFLQEGTVEGSLEQRLIEENLPVGCGFCHIPYDELNMPFPAHLTYCYNCRKQKVPDVLFTTIDLPTDAVVVGKGCLIQARLCRLKKKAQAEANATAISNLLPFMEYEVHTQLMNKLKLKGMNALFGLRIQITVGENMLMGLASATGVYIAALPTPGGIQIAGKTPNDGSYEQHISHMQKRINDTIAKNKELYEINPPEVSEEIIGSPIPEPRQRSRLLRSQSESSDEVTELDLSHGKKDAFVLEIDDTDAMEDVHSLLTDVPPPSGTQQASSEIKPVCTNVLMFTSVRVVRLSSLNLTNQALNKNFNGLCENLLKSLYFKLRSMTPCCLCHVNFTVSLPEDELIQVTVTAVAITFDKNQALQTTKAHAEKTLQRASTDNDELLQFPLELCSDSLPAPAFPATKATSVDYSSFADRCSSWIELIKLKAQTIRRGSIKTTVTVEKASPMGDGNFRNRSAPPCASSTVGVVKMTPLSFIPGAKITKYLGIINMFFIRETTSLREEGGVSGFLHAFIAEVFAMVRAHVAALGGNAVVSYIMKQCVFMENPSKNQAQCLINVSGDAVVFVRESDLEAMSTQQSAVNCQTSCPGEVTT